MQQNMRVCNYKTVYMTQQNDVYSPIKQCILYIDQQNGVYIMQRNGVYDTTKRCI